MIPSRLALSLCVCVVILCNCRRCSCLSSGVIGKHICRSRQRHHRKQRRHCENGNQHPCHFPSFTHSQYPPFFRPHSHPGPSLCYPFTGYNRKNSYLFNFLSFIKYLILHCIEQDERRDFPSPSLNKCDSSPQLRSSRRTGFPRTPCGFRSAPL